MPNISPNGNTTDKPPLVGKNAPLRPRMIRARLNEVEALRLRAQGLSLRAIARELGTGSQAGVLKAINRALEDLKRTREDVVLEYAGVQLERMRIALEAIMPRVTEGDIEAIETMLRIEGRTAKLLALDHPGHWPEDGMGRSMAPGALSISFDQLSDGQLESLKMLGIGPVPDEVIDATLVEDDE